MQTKSADGASSWVDPDDAAELTAEDFARADVYKAGQLVRRGGRPRAAETKASVTMRLDRDVLEALRASGDGWQTRVNDMLRAAMGGNETPQQAMHRAMRQAQDDARSQHKRQVTELYNKLRGLTSEAEKLTASFDGGGEPVGLGQQ